MTISTSFGGRSRTIVFVHAHPDDEALLTAGTMARAAAEGLRVVLIVATDGAAGLTSRAHRTGLGQVRAVELQQSAAALHVARLVQLGYPDSGLLAERADGFANADRFDVAKAIGTVLDEERADIVVGYDPSGGYGHPDHLQVHRAVRAAALLAQHTPRLFEATLPREPIVTAVHAAAALHLTPRAFDPASFDAAWTTRQQISHRVDVRAYLPQKLASLRAHASQATADDSLRTLAVLTRLPGPLRSLLLGTEYYVQVSTPSAARPALTAPSAS